MRQYKKIFFTNLPAFYKINLFNQISKNAEILVAFTGQTGGLGRKRDFFEANMEFDCRFLSPKLPVRMLQVIRILITTSYEELVIGGWDSPEMWLCSFFSKRARNSLVLESSYKESVSTGLRGFLKKLFLRRISKVYASGKSQAKLVRKLGFRKKVAITKGVGIINFVDQPIYKEVETINRFLYVGRFSSEKNIRALIDIFIDELPQLQLELIGYGPLEDEIKKRSERSSNISILGVYRK